MLEQNTTLDQLSCGLISTGRHSFDVKSSQFSQGLFLISCLWYLLWLSFDPEFSQHSACKHICCVKSIFWLREQGLRSTSAMLFVPQITPSGPPLCPSL